MDQFPPPPGDESSRSQQPPPLGAGNTPLGAPAADTAATRTPPMMPVASPSTAAPVAPPPTFTPSDDRPSDDRPSDGRWKRRIGLGVAGLLLAVGGGAVGALGVTMLDDDDDATTVVNPQADGEAAESDEGVVVATTTDTSGDIDVRAVAESVAPSVVTISADIGDSDEDIMSGTSVGSGVIISADGEVLTNAHVVDGATEIRVRLNGETEPVTAELLAADSINDLALLKLDGDGYTPAVFADSDSTELGDQVVAIGFALDLDGDPSVTLGIVSALDRTLNMGNSEVLDGLVQTDAAISSGNSGGPLVNNQGQVVGINTAVAHGDMFTTATNVGFTISVEEIMEVLPKLRAAANGEVQAEGYLGVSLTQRTDGGQGALIGEVTPDTPAGDAGVETGDLIVAVDGVGIDGADALIATIGDQSPGDVVTLTIVRDGEELEIDVTLAERPEDL